MPSIPSTSNSVLRTSAETTMKERDGSSDRKSKHSNAANSNANFDLSIADLSDSVDSTEKNGVATQPTLLTPDRTEGKIADLSPEEIACRGPKLPCQKMKSHVDLSGLSAEEAFDFKDYGTGNGRHTQQALSNAKKFFTPLACSKDPRVLSVLQ